MGGTALGASGRSNNGLKLDVKTGKLSLWRLFPTFTFTFIMGLGANGSGRVDLVGVRFVLFLFVAFQAFANLHLPRPVPVRLTGGGAVAGSSCPSPSPTPGIPPRHEAPVIDAEHDEICRATGPLPPSPSAAAASPRLRCRQCDGARPPSRLRRRPAARDGLANGVQRCAWRRLALGSSSRPRPAQRCPGSRWHRG